MIDGSKLPLEENTTLTRKTCKMCAAAGVPVEGEINRMGGKEDDQGCHVEIYSSRFCPFRS